MKTTAISALVALTAFAVATTASAQSGHFDGPVDAVWMPDGRHMVLTKAITFTDSQGRTWPVPAGTETDGASIPQAFWWIIGGPFEGKYRQAAVVHDFYCDVRRRSWQDVDHMFYDAMLSAGVPPATAKAMFYAVWAEGPHWDDQTLNNVWLAYPPDGGPAIAAAVPNGPPQPAAPPRAYADAKAASLASHQSHLAFAQQALGNTNYSALTNSFLSTRHPSNDPHIVAARIMADDPPLADVEKAAEAARLARSALQ